MTYVWLQDAPNHWVRCIAFQPSPLTMRATAETFYHEKIVNLRWHKAGDGIFCERILQ